jgi:integrase
MPSLTITTRRTKSGPRYVVRYRLGGRAYPVEHGGSFKTLRDAKARRALIGGELANGRNPRDLLQAMTAAPAPVLTFAQWAERYRASRLDFAQKTSKNMTSHLKTLNGIFAERDPATITVADVQSWIGASKLKPSSLRRYLATLRAVLDFVGLEENVARDPRVKLPKEEPTIVDPPGAADVDAILEHSPKRWRLPLRTLEQTGMRVGELHQLEWRDVDLAGSRFRVRHGKTATARRWVAVPEWLMEEIDATTPLDDHTSERRVFVGFSPDVAKNVIARACRAAGIVHRHPHDFRHRYASVQIARGVPVTEVAAQLGHSRKSLTLDVYSHVMLAER